MTQEAFPQQTNWTDKPMSPEAAAWLFALVIHINALEARIAALEP